jgi:hypothetical protein
MRPLVEIFEVALEVGRVVARVADRQHVIVGSETERIDNLERASLLPLDAVGVDRVDEVNI